MNVNESANVGTDKADSIVAELRKRGLSNGGSLGFHSGLMDEAADLIESQQAEIERLKNGSIPAEKTMTAARLQRRLDRAEARLAPLKAREEHLSQHGHWEMGYLQGKISVLEEWLDEA